ncbi:MAG: TlpA family protein disulfide reductase [Dehalococcoidia bacterium]|nr:TlpA family protein disulfide reductase [Dehalococcoidia bacterium]
MNGRTLARYSTVAAIVLVVGGLFVYQQVGSSADTDDDAPLGVVAGAAPPALGEPAPDFVLVESGSGKRVSLSDFRGQPVVLNFWATWCVPCRTEMPDLQAAYDSEDVVVLAVNWQETESVVQGFLDEFGITFPTALDSEGRVREFYGVVGLPATFFIDPDGILRARNFGPVYGNLLQDGIEAAR